MAKSTAAAEAGNLVNAYRALKIAAVVIGFPCAIISWMALIGGVVENGYVRIIGAIALGIGLPLFVADRLLDKDPAKRSMGLVTDVIAIMWLGTAVIFTGVLNGATRSMLATEGDRLTLSAYPNIASVAYFLAGVNATPAATPAPKGSASASAGPSASPPRSSASPSASASAAPAPSASIAPGGG